MVTMDRFHHYMNLLFRTSINIPIAFFVAIMVCFLAGCSFGPRMVQGNRLDYNITIQKSNNEELLLNLVRARYAEPLFFLQIGSISSSFGYTANAGASATFMSNLRNRASVANLFTPSIGAGISEMPTITYSPLQGEKAVRQLQTELRLDRFLILTRIGYDIETLLWTTVTRIGDLRNIEVSVTTEKDRKPTYGEFLELARLLFRMQRRGDLEFVGIAKGERGTDSLTMQLRYDDEEEADKIEGLLGIRGDRTPLPDSHSSSTIELTSVRDLAPPRMEEGEHVKVPIKLKSFFEMIFDLSFHVEATADELEGKIALPYRDFAGETQYRRGPHMGLIRVKSSSFCPDDAYIAVTYRNRCFYIGDNDLRSKIFLIFIGAIFSLQSGELQTAAPLLTLPVVR